MINRPLTGQSNFERLYAPFGQEDSWGYRVVVNQPDDLLYLGFNQLTENGYRPGFYTLDFNGNGIDSFSLSDYPTLIFQRGMELGTSGTVFLYGEEYVDEEVFISPYIMKVSAQGDILWKKTYDSGALEDYTLGLMQLPDSTYTCHLYGGINGGPVKHWLLRIDGDGNELSKREIVTGYERHSLGSLALQPDGGAVLTFNFEIPEDDSYNNRLAGAAIDSTGSIRYLRRYGIWTDAHEEFFLPSTDYPGDGVVSCHMKVPLFTFSQANDFYLSHVFTPLIRRLDDNGEVVWEVLLGDKRFKDVERLRVDSAGYIYVIGTAENTRHLPYARYPWLAKISPYGELLWERTYRSGFANIEYNTPNTTLRDLDFLPDGRLVLTGNYQIDEIFHTYPFVFTLYDNGCFGEGDCGEVVQLPQQLWQPPVDPDKTRLTEPALPLSIPDFRQ